MSKLILFVMFICLRKCSGGKDGKTLEDKNTIEFFVQKIPVNPTYLPKYRMEHAERNTSKDYDYWKQMDINLIEWPGNITKLEVNYPLLRWGKRAKLVQSPCSVVLGMDFKAYAYKYVHLTWGPFRMTTSYCPPLKLPRSVFQDRLPVTMKNSAVISATDFEFVSDSFLIIVESEFIIRVGQLEASHRNEGSMPIPSRDILSYELAMGVTSPVTKLVVQNCCKNRMTKTCTHGDILLAFDERSQESSRAGVFISYDTGRTFAKLLLQPFTSSRLHSVLLFPRLQFLLAFHGDHDFVTASHYSLTTGRLAKEEKTSKAIRIEGIFQAKQIGEEDSILAWDECSVWYSSDAGFNFTETMFYIHNTIQRDLPGKDNEPRTGKHRISKEHCYLGRDSIYAQDAASGKVAILDSQNNFFYGIDTKSRHFTLVGSNMDMSLLLPNKIHSIVPFFDFNNRPKLMYPPRYLYSEDDAYKDKNYKNRLGIRLFPRSVFPSDFMPPFYEENIPTPYKNHYGLKTCQTSSIIVDSGLSQKPKIFYTFENTQFNFTVEFKSNRNDSHQLNWLPNIEKSLKINSVLSDFMQLGLKHYFYFKYIITVLPRPIAFAGSLFRLEFFTLKSLRCVHQPQVTIWIQIETSTVSEDRKREILKTSMADPEPVRELRNFLNGTQIRKIIHEKNPMNIHQCSSQKSVLN